MLAVSKSEEAIAKTTQLTVSGLNDKDDAQPQVEFSEMGILVPWLVQKLADIDRGISPVLVNDNLILS